MKSMRSHIGKASRGATVALALGATGHAQVDVDGTLTEGEGYSRLALQSAASNWGAGNYLGHLNAVQDGSSLALFVGGKPSNNAIILFIDSKPGGVGFIANNQVQSGGEEYTLNNLGTSDSSGMTFENGFTPDYAIRIWGDGVNQAQVNLYDLQTRSREYFGQTVANEPPAKGIAQAIRTTWADSSFPYDTVTSGVELKLGFAALGVPTGTGQTIKMMGLLVNGGSDWASNQVLGPRTSSSADIGAGRNSINFETEPGVQTLAITVNNADNDGDGNPDASDPDDDNDGLADSVETGTGIYVSATDTGTKPQIADSDGDGHSDGEELTSVLGFLSDPNIRNFASMAVPGNYTTPQWQADGSAGNGMTVAGDSLTAQYEWRLNYRFTTAGAIEYKLAANGGWTNNWGAADGGNLQSAIETTGFHTFTFNNATLARSLARTVFADAAAFLDAYGLAAEPTGDADQDGVTNQAEFTANSDPTQSDTDGDGLLDGADANPLVDDNLDGDLDKDGLADTVETGTGIFVSASDTGTKPDVADTDGDGHGDGAEVGGTSNLGYASDPNLANHLSMAVPGDFTNPQWQADGSAGNAMTQAGTADLVSQYQWKLDYRFSTIGPIQYKYAANGGWNLNWGGGINSSDNLTAMVHASGFHRFAFDTATGTKTFQRTVFADAAAFLTAYGLDSDPNGDTDSDGVSNTAEFTANTDPTAADSDLDGAADAGDPAPLLATRDVVFSVDMSVQQLLGRFDPVNGTVVVKFFSGVMAGQPDLVLSEVGDSGVYGGTLKDVAGPVGSAFGTYKFFNTTNGAPNGGYEQIANDRSIALGDANATQNVAGALFSDEQAPAGGYAAWAAANAGGGAFGADHDGDGVANGLEYFTGSAGASPQPVNGVVVWLRNPAATDVTFQVLGSTDLATWTDVTQSTDVSDPASIRHTLPADGPRRFVRLVVSPANAP